MQVNDTSRYSSVSIGWYMGGILFSYVLCPWEEARHWCLLRQEPPFLSNFELIILEPYHGSTFEVMAQNCCCQMLMQDAAQNPHTPTLENLRPSDRNSNNSYKESARLPSEARYSSVSIGWYMGGILFSYVLCPWEEARHWCLLRQEPPFLSNFELIILEPYHGSTFEVMAQNCCCQMLMQDAAQNPHTPTSENLRSPDGNSNDCSKITRLPSEVGLTDESKVTLAKNKLSFSKGIPGDKSVLTLQVWHLVGPRVCMELSLSMKIY